ncbi:MAG TPA: hypothetical protein VEK76_09495 [Candidatus Binatia bacterium]|nr:hypothetical protein [Candidatus Binatia bacterium]
MQRERNSAGAALLCRPIITDDRPLTEYRCLAQLFPSAHDPPVSDALLRRLAP